MDGLAQLTNLTKKVFLLPYVCLNIIIIIIISFFFIISYLHAILPVIQCIASHW